MHVAELDGTDTVLRVVVAPDVAWCVTHLGGTWAACGDPGDSGAINYAGIGWMHAATSTRKFGQPWARPEALVYETAIDEVQSGYARGTMVVYQGDVWVSLVDANHWSPDERNWIVAPIDLTGLPVGDGSTITEWDRNVDYIVDDLVWDQTGGYICIQAHTSKNNLKPNSTPTHWTQIVSRSEVT